MTRARNISRILSAQEISGDINLSGIVTATEFYGDGSNLTGISTLGNVTAGVVTANQFSGNITGTAATFSGNVTIGGVLTYDDVTNVDSLGIITARSGVSIADSIFHTGDTNTAIRFPAADTFTVETSGSEALRVDSSQQLLLGTTSSFEVGSSAASDVQLTGSLAFQSLSRFSANGAGPNLIFGKSRNASPGSYTVVQADDDLGNITFAGDDGTDLQSVAARIVCEVDGTPGSNDMPGRLTFNTTADGASSPTERLRVDSSGRLLVGTTSSKTGLRLQVEGTTSSHGLSVRRNQSGSAAASIILAKSRGSSVGSATIVQDDDTIGTLQFSGADGTNDIAGAFIRAQVDGTPGTDDMPGRLILATTADGASTPTERLRVTSTGGVHFNNAELIERVKITSGKLSENTTINLDNGMVHYFTTTETTTAIPNITTTAGINTNMATGDTMSVTIITTAATAGYSTGARIDAGATLPVLWNGGSDPSAGGDGGVDAYTYQIIKTGDAAFTVLGNVSNFA